VPAAHSSSLLVRWREPLEWLALIVVAAALVGCYTLLGPSARQSLAAAVAVWAAIKTVYYFAETLRHLLEAIAKDLAYHRFLLIVAYNMAQITLSFAIDFYCLFWIDPDSLSIDNDMGGLELMFECFYFSVLNFSFFGYGDITPHHVSSKFVMLLEVVTAFSTVIFLLSDFISMKEAIRRKGA